jgi:hypothetical protein
LSHLWPTGSSAGQPPSITARYFSSCPSDSTSRWTPCPPQENNILLRPARHYPRFWIWHPSSECQRDFNPPEQCAAQRTLRRSPTSPARTCPSCGLAPSRTDLRKLPKACWRSPGSRPCCFISVRGFLDYAGPVSHSRVTQPPYCLPPTRKGVGILIFRLFEAQ